MTTDRGGGRRLFVSVLIIVLILVAVGLAQTSTGQSVLRSLGLTARHSGFTALYFPYAAELPAAKSGRRGHQQVVFVISNREGRRMSYDWRVSVSGQGVRLIGTDALPPGHDVRISQRLALRCPAGRKRVTVSLISPAQSIGYWVRCRP